MRLESAKAVSFSSFSARAHLVRSSSWLSKDLLFLTASPYARAISAEGGRKSPFPATMGSDHVSPWSTPNSGISSDAMRVLAKPAPAIISFSEPR